jgi:hypothetical protein
MPGGIDVAVRFEAGPGATWLDAAPVREGGSFELAGFPTTGGTLIASRDGRTISAGAPRDHAELAWPKGSTADIIVRGAKGDTDVYVLRGHRDVHARAQLLALAKTETDLAVLSAQTIGFSTETDNGARMYQVGDVHAVVRESAPGDITACALPADEAASVFCGHATVPANGEVAMLLTPK